MILITVIYMKIMHCRQYRSNHTLKFSETFDLQIHVIIVTSFYVVPYYINIGLALFTVMTIAIYI